MVMLSRDEMARNGPLAAGGGGSRAPRAAWRSPAVSPVLPDSPGWIAVVCLPEDLAYAERELVGPLVAAGFQVALETMLPGQALEVPDPCCRLVLLDITPKDPRGYAVCTELRDRLGLPLMLVLRGAASDDILRGYEAGADSCLVAPFDVREFLARLAALLRRRPPPSPGARSTE